MKGGLGLLCAALLLLTGCAPAAREPDDLALVRVIGVDGAGPVTLTAVCGGENGQDVVGGSASGEDFEQARKELPWSGKGQELALTGVSYLLIGPDADLSAVLSAVLEDADLGASAAVWFVEDGAGDLLDDCEDPAADLEILTLRGTTAPSVAQAAAALSTDGTVTLPCLVEQDGRLEERGTKVWNEDN